MQTFMDGALILNLRDVTFTEFNVTARDILERTDGFADAAQVAEYLAQEYDIDFQEALADVNELYQQLLSQDLIERVDSHQDKEG